MKPYYEEENITVYHGDCREVLPHVGRFDLCLTDPPYNDQTHDGAKTGDGDVQLVDFASVTSEYLRGVFELIDLHGWAVATMAWQHVADLERFPPKGLRFVRFGVWHKPNGMPQMSGDRPSAGWEAVCIMHKADGRMKWNGGGRHAFWSIPKIEGEHPTTKPLPLVLSWLSLFNPENGRVIDPFLGSGTTLVACKALGIRGVGIEREEKYCELAVKRLTGGDVDRARQRIINGKLSTDSLFEE